MPESMVARLCVVRESDGRYAVWVMRDRWLDGAFLGCEALSWLDEEPCFLPVPEGARCEELPEPFVVLDVHALEDWADTLLGVLPPEETEGFVSIPEAPPPSSDT